MTQKHTPAPWDGAYFNGHYFEVTPNQDNCCTGNISVFIGAEGDKSVAQANAHLIAAAPELLEVLENLLSDMHHIKLATGIEFDTDSACAVISKAKGEVKCS